MITRTLHALGALLVFLVSACGGGGGGGNVAGGGTGGTGAVAVSEGVMTVGSAIVNGVRFDTSSAALIVLIDDQPRTAADLKSGMVIKLRGSVNSDNVSGSADRIEVENEVRGLVQDAGFLPNANPPTFRVNGQTVIADDLTIFANIANVTNLVAGVSAVEVHGQRETDGRIRASRIESFGGASPGDELRGTIANLNTQTLQFTIGGTAVSYTNTQYSPSGTTSAANLANGTLVEVHGNFSAVSGTFTATRIDFEELEDALFQPSSNGKLYVEGFVTGFTAHPGTFAVNGRSVQTTVTTQFENGAIADLANNSKVEAEGRVTNGVLVAEKISFRRTRTIVTGQVSALDLAACAVTILGKTVKVNDATEVSPTAGGSTTGCGNTGANLSWVIPNNTRIEARGYVEPGGGSIVAERLDGRPSGGGRDFIQGIVTAKDAGLSTLALLGITANLINGGVQFKDLNDGPLSRQQFFAAVTPANATTAGTVVKVKGTFSGGVLVAEEAELEN
ncbi:MAG: DUF5666 domain-containing protein [Burkholderiales bacterium]